MAGSPGTRCSPPNCGLYRGSHSYGRGYAGDGVCADRPARCLPEPRVIASAAKGAQITQRAARRTPRGTAVPRPVALAFEPTPRLRERAGRRVVMRDLRPRDLASLKKIDAVIAPSLGERRRSTRLTARHVFGVQISLLDPHLVAVTGEELDTGVDLAVLGHERIVAENTPAFERPDRQSVWSSRRGRSAADSAVDNDRACSDARWR